jgi:hypothetical protein
MRLGSHRSASPCCLRTWQYPERPADFPGPPGRTFAREHGGGAGWRPAPATPSGDDDPTRTSRQENDSRRRPLARGLGGCRAHGQLDDDLDCPLVIAKPRIAALDGVHGQDGAPCQARKHRPISGAPDDEASRDGDGQRRLIGMLLDVLVENPDSIPERVEHDPPTWVGGPGQDDRLPNASAMGAFPFS